MALEKSDDVNTKPKAPFTAVVTITAHDEHGGLHVINQTIEADTLRELRSQMDGAEAVTQGQSRELDREMKITFSHVMQLDPEKSEYIPLQARGLLSLILYRFPANDVKEASGETKRSIARLLFGGFIEMGPGKESR